MQYTFRKPLPFEVPTLSVLLKAIWVHTYATEGMTSKYTNFINAQFSEQQILAELNSDQIEIQVAYFQNNPIGVAKVEYTKPSPIGNIVSAELNKLYVLNHFHGKGVGLQLLEKIESIAKAKGEKEMWLWTYIKNERAIKFYEKQSYKWIGNADFIIDDNSYVNKILLKQL